MHNPASYDVSFYSTSDTSLIYRYATNNEADLLTINVPRTDSLNYDYAFVVKVHGTSFKTGIVDNNVIARNNDSENILNQPNIIAFNNVSERIFVYPNPARDMLNVDIFSYNGENADNSAIEIYDMTGRKLYGKTGLTSRNSIDISEFVTGIYIVRLLIGNNDIVNYKIIKK